MKKKVKKAAPVITEKNWGEIDATIRSVADPSKTKKALFAEIKERFSWNDSQCNAAINPIIKRWYKMLK